MDYRHLLQSSQHEGNVRLWRHGEFPMPDWVPGYMAGGIEANGTFILETELGRARVHLNNIVIECRGRIWVRSSDEVDDFIKDLNAEPAPEITNIGPGKRHQFGNENINTEKLRGKNTKISEKRPKYGPPIGQLPSIEWIQINRLSVDEAYQRSTDNVSSRRLISSIAHSFDWRLCSPLVVSRRADDTLTIIDGQHRWMAACRRDDIPQLPCCVFRYQDRQEEARMFIVANRARKPMNRLDDYFAAIAAADEDALEIKQMVDDAGLSIARTTSSVGWRAGEVAFTSAIANAIRRFGVPITSAVLTNMSVAFAGQRLTHGGAIFGGLIRIMANPGPDFDPDRLVSALQSKTVEEWGGFTAGENGNDRRVAALQAAIWEEYKAYTEIEELEDQLA